MMRAFFLIASCMLSAVADAKLTFLDLGETQVIVIRPSDHWDPNRTTANYTLKNLRSKNFSFQYIDAAGATVMPRSAALFREKVSTPLTVEVEKILVANGFGNIGSHVYFVSGAVTIAPERMNDFVAAQNLLYRNAVIKQGDPATLSARVAARKATGILATAATTGIGTNILGANTVTLSQYSTLYTDIIKLAGGVSGALVPVPLPSFDFSTFSSVEVRRVTDNARHVGQIIIGYRTEKTAASELAALAQAIAVAGGVGTTAEEVDAARVSDFENRVAIWAECVATPGCVSD